MNAKAKTVTAVLCRDCKYYQDNDRNGHWCSRWRYGYHAHPLIAPNDIIVEDDEGWGADMGPEFGCVLGELREGE